MATLFGFVLASGSMLNQARAQAPAPQQNQGGLALAVTPPTAAHLSIAHELMQQIGAERMFDALVPNMGSQIANTILRTRPELTTDLKDVIAKISPDFDKQKQGLIDSAVLIFARAMTEQELRETVTYMKTPAGQKFLDTQSQTITTVASLLDQWNRQLSVEMFDRVRAEMKLKGHEL
jgi:hypothetical protein